MPTPRPLVNAAQIARLAGVTRATVSNWRRRHPDFPRPVDGSEARPRYDLDQVRTWLADRGRLPPDSPADELRAALPADRNDEAPPHRLWPLLLAAHRAGDTAVKSLLKLPDSDLLRRLPEWAKYRAPEVPGAELAMYRPDDLPAVRALLRGVLAGDASDAADVLAKTGAAAPIAGTYPTPPPLATLMANLITSHDRSFPARVLDPACGGGRLLAAAAHGGAKHLSGQDALPQQAAQTAVRLGLLPTPLTIEIRVGDSLRADAFDGQTADAVLCNPPYGTRDWGHDELAYDPRWAYGLPPKGEPELAWVQHCLAHLVEGGTAVVLMPPAASERPSGRRIRAELVRAGALRAVVALPSGIAAPWHVGLHLWLLRRPCPQELPTTVLFVDASSSTAPERTPVDWPALHRVVGEAWQAFTSGEDPGTPGTARRVATIDLLDDAVDLTPARHVFAVPAAGDPTWHAQTAQALRRRLHHASTALASLTDADTPWPPAGTERRTWRTATVADLRRGGAVALLRAGSGEAIGDEVVTAEGDLVLVESRRHPGPAITVVTGGAVGQPLARDRSLLRPDPTRFDPWFLAGFLAAEENLHVASTGISAIRIEPRRLRVPLLPLAEQKRYGEAFRRLHTLRAAAHRATRLAEETTRSLAAGLTGGTLLPPADSGGTSAVSAGDPASTSGEAL